MDHFFQELGKNKTMGNKNSGRPKYGTTPPKDEIVKLYFDEILTQAEIGQKYNVSQKVVFRWFKNLGIKCRAPVKRNQRGENNNSWKGNKVTYAAYHYRVRSVRGKADKCEECGRCDKGITYDWANQNGNYEDVNDYKMMCRSCHFKKDGHRHNLPNRTRSKNENKEKIIDGK